jgi:hypothetical protein
MMLNKLYGKIFVVFDKLPTPTTIWMMFDLLHMQIGMMLNNPNFEISMMLDNTDFSIKRNVVASTVPDGIFSRKSSKEKQQNEAKRHCKLRGTKQEANRTTEATEKVFNFHFNTN